MSMREKPSWAMAWAMTSDRSLSKAVLRATKLAPLTCTVAQMSRGRSRLPRRVVAVIAPWGVVTECSPPVMPKLKLLKTSTVTPMFRRAALIRWCPPMPQPPSPMRTITLRSGLASLMPLA